MSPLIFHLTSSFWIPAFIRLWRIYRNPGVFKLEYTTISWLRAYYYDHLVQESGAKREFFTYVSCKI
jgi:hypothetical protein